MKYRTKLFLSFTLVVFVSSLLALMIVYIGSHKLLFNQIRSELLSIAITSAASINGDDISQFTSKESEDTVAYQNLINQLRFIRDSNRRPDLYIKYIYVIRRNPAGQYLFVADAEENPADIAHFGEPMPSIKELDTSNDLPLTLSKPTPDQWGVWVSAFAPIYNSQERVVAMLGVDLSAQDVEKQMRYLALYGLIALAGALILSIIIAHLLSKLVTNSLFNICQCAKEIGLGNLRARVYLNTQDEFNDLANTINSMAKSIEDKERLTLSFSRYVSQHVLETILHSDKPTKLEGEKRKVTIMFSDIRQFTTLAESLPPEDVVALLNEYFEKMISIIFSYRGTLDKFIGDGIMAEFGAPLEDINQELNAVRAAIHMQSMVKKLSKNWKEKQRFDIAIGIGIHTGFAVVGNIGSTVRMEYTAIGDTVNVASRLEQMTKSLGKQIIISEETYRAIYNHPEFSFEDLGEIRLKGREHPIKAYAVFYEENILTTEGL